MAWPPPVLPTNRSNALPQQDEHPADHNAVNLAVNDIVTKLKAQVLDVNVQALARDSRVYFRATTVTFTTNGSGDAIVAFDSPFPNAFVVAVGWPGDVTAPGNVGATVGLRARPNANGLQTRCFNAAGAPLASTTFRLDYIAIGVP